MTTTKKPPKAEAKAAKPDAEALKAETLEFWGNYRESSRKTAVALWEFGRSCHKCKNKLDKSWKAWCEENDVSVETANQAIRLYRWDRLGEKIKEYDGITAAKIAAGIVQARIPASSKPATEVEDKFGFGRFDLEELEQEHRRLCEAVGSDVVRLEDAIDDLDAGEVPVVAEIIDAAIERLQALRNKMGE